MQKGDLIGYQDAVTQAKTFITEGASPEDAAKRVLTEWHLEEDVIRKFATTGLYMAVQGERSVPA